MKTTIICPSKQEFNILNKAGLKADIVCSGMGKIRSALSTNSLSGNVILTGFAGGISGVRLGSVVTPVCAIEGDFDVRPLESFPNTINLIKYNIPGAIDATVITKDVFERNGRNSFNISGSVICDMESYAVAYVCKRKKLPLIIVKVVSDMATDTAHSDFILAVKELSELVIDVTSKAVETFSKKRVTRK